MKVKIERKAEKGQCPSTTLYIDGEECSSFDYNGSRLLTDTDSEDSHGIFSTEYRTVVFNRGDAFVAVDFGNLFPKKSEFNLLEIESEIRRRAALVKNAFDEKYPFIDQSVSFTL